MVGLARGRGEDPDRLSSCWPGWPLLCAVRLSGSGSPSAVCRLRQEPRSGVHRKAIARVAGGSITSSPVLKRRGRWPTGWGMAHIWSGEAGRFRGTRPDGPPPSWPLLRCCWLLRLPPLPDRPRRQPRLLACPKPTLTARQPSLRSPVRRGSPRRATRTSRLACTTARSSA